MARIGGSSGGSGSPPDATPSTKGLTKLSAELADPVAVADSDPRLTDARAPTSHSHAQSDVTGLVAALAGKAASSHTHDWADVTGEPTFQLTSEKAQANGYASLGADGKVPSAQLPAGSGGFDWVYVGRQVADLTNATTTPAATDLVFTFAANGVYAIDLYLICTSAATTTGYGFALDTSVAPTAVALHFNHVLANTGTTTSGNSIADNTSLGVTSGVASANTLTPILGSGLLVAGAGGGTARLVFRPEVAASAVFKANSVMRVHQVA